MAFLTSVIILFDSKDKVLRWFPYYLGFILIAELTGRYVRKILHQPNVWVYNLSIPVEYLFYGFVFWRAMRLISNRYLAKWFLVLFFLFVVLNITVVQGLGVFNSNVALVGSFFMMLLSGLMLYEIYSSESVNKIWLEPIFWISIGVLLFNAGEFTYDLLSVYLINSEIDKAARFFATINNKLIFVLYTCLTISFLCHRNTEISKKA